jgi:hypothetical protein
VEYGPQTKPTARQRALNRHRAEIMDLYPDVDPKIKAVFQTRAVAVGHVG